jgi:hypothetical protein
MRAGRRVIVMSESLLSARSAMQDVAAQLEPGETARRSNGHEECIGTGPGRIRFLSARSKGVRGMSADVLFADADLTREQLEDILPALALSSHRELMLR